MKLYPERKAARICVCGIFTALLCVLSIITLPVQPVPITLGLLGVFLVGAALPPLAAALCALCYLIIGAVGVPVFAGFAGGVGGLLGPTGGFLMSYPVCAALAALICGRAKRSRGIGRYIVPAAAFAAATAVCYAAGTAWYCLFAGVGVKSALTVCVLPFALFDALKIVCATALSAVLRRVELKSDAQ